MPLEERRRRTESARGWPRQAMNSFLLLNQESEDHLFMRVAIDPRPDSPGLCQVFFPDRCLQAAFSRFRLLGFCHLTLPDGVEDSVNVTLQVRRAEGLPLRPIEPHSAAVT